MTIVAEIEKHDAEDKTITVVSDGDGKYNIYNAGILRHSNCSSDDAIRALAHYLNASYYEQAKSKSVTANTFGYHTHYYAWSSAQQKWRLCEFSPIHIKTLTYTDQNATSFFEGAGFKTWAALRIIEAWNRRGNSDGYKYKLNDN